MKFPISELDLDEYFEKILEVINDPDSKIFIDTNILAKYYVFHNSARKELNEWLKDYAQKQQLLVPAWVLNEYSKHYIRKRTGEYLSDGNLISDIDKKFTTFKGFLPMYTEQSELSQHGYVDHEALKSEMDEVQKKLKKFAKMKASKKEHEIKMNNEITELLKDCILETDIFTLSEKVGQLAPLRYANQIPPGFEDGDKGLNTSGDLILWTEILDYCKNKEIKKVILLTEDGKRDWVYAPQKIKIGGRTKPNPQPNYKLIDSRLSYEFKLATQSEDIYIITLTMLTQAMLQSGNQDLFQIAKALQIQYEEEQQNAIKESNEAEEQASSIVEAVNPEIEDLPANADNGAEVPIEHAGNAAEHFAPYSPESIADRDFKDFTNTVLSDLVEALKSLNWYKQNPTVDSLLKMRDGDFEQNNSIQNELFVLGRNIYQAASGGAWTVHSYVERLSKITDDPNPFMHKHLINGMMFEIFFGPDGKLRKGHFKIGMLDTLLAYSIRNQYNPFEFIDTALTPFTDFLIKKPGDEREQLNFNLEGIIVADNDNMIFGPQATVSQIRLGEVDLIHDRVGQKSHGEFLDIRDVQRLIQKTFGLPVDIINIQLGENISEANLFRFPSDKILWKGPLPPPIEEYIF